MRVLQTKLRTFYQSGPQYLRWNKLQLQLSIYMYMYLYKPKQYFLLQYI